MALSEEGHGPYTFTKPTRKIVEFYVDPDGTTLNMKVYGTNREQTTIEGYAAWPAAKPYVNDMTEVLFQGHPNLVSGNIEITTAQIITIMDKEPVLGLLEAFWVEFDGGGASASVTLVRLREVEEAGAK